MNRASQRIMIHRIHLLPFMFGKVCNLAWLCDQHFTFFFKKAKHSQFFYFLRGSKTNPLLPKGPDQISLPLFFRKEAASFQHLCAYSHLDGRYTFPEGNLPNTPRETTLFNKKTIFWKTSYKSPNISTRAAHFAGCFSHTRINPAIDAYTFCYSTISIFSLVNRKT